MASRRKRAEEKGGAAGRTGIVEAVVFDLGGVLVDHDDARAWKALGRVLAAPAAEVRRLMVDEGLKLRQDRGELSPQGFFRAACERFGGSPPAERFWDAWSDIFTEKKAVTDIVYRLDGVAPLYLLSNTDPVHYAFLRDRYSFMRLFEGEVLSFETGAVKPEPAIYREVVKLAKVPAGHCLFFDDLPENVEGARTAGMNAHLFRGAALLDEELARHGLLGDGGD
jgi:FMN phosphatase YigB (HAD superfamily)